MVHTSLEENTKNDTRPLLQNTASKGSATQQKDIPENDNCPGHRTPLPRVQLGILCFLRILDPLTFSQIFPYVNHFMSDLHVTEDPTQIGYYSGLVESAFAVTQLLVIYPWGYMSDGMGRRPIVLAGVTGLTLSTLLFGLSKTFAEALIFRALAGLFSGNVAVIPSMLCEITDKTNQSFAFPFFGLWWPVGSIIGPLIGGYFAKPADKFKLLDIVFFRTYPYFLPGFIVSAVSALGLVLGYFLLAETSKKIVVPAADCATTYGTMDTGKDDNTSKRYNVRQLVAIPMIKALCASGCALSFISTAFDVSFVLFCYTPIQNGGLNFSTSQIGFALATAGALAALLQLLFMPTILQRVDHAHMYNFCMKIWPFTFLALPCLNLVARHFLMGGAEYEYLGGWILWTGIAIILAMARVAFLAYSVNLLLVKRHAPSQTAIGSTTSLVQFSICLSRSFSPAFASSLFALSNTRPNLLGGYGWAAVMAAICFCSCTFSKRIVKESAKC